MQILRKNYAQFLDNTRVLQKYKIIAAYRRNQNLQDQLVHSKLKPIKNTMKKRSVEFKHLFSVTNLRSKMKIKLGSPLCVKTKNCVYLIYCSKCNMKYVEETKNSIQTRLIQHRYNIRHQKRTDTHLVQHFIQHKLESLRVMGLQTNPIWTDSVRQKQERLWINILGTKYPWGLNEQ